jgi:hypothetical protein
MRKLINPGLFWLAVSGVVFGVLAVVLAPILAIRIVGIFAIISNGFFVYFRWTE